MKTDNDTFYNIKERNLDDRRRLLTLTYVSGVNFAIFLCLFFNWYWWKDCEAMAYLLSVLYFLLVFALHMSYHKNRGLFYIFDLRNECYKDYYESPNFVYHFPPCPKNNDTDEIIIISNQIDYAPIYDGDFIVLSNADCSTYKYLRVRKSAYFIGKDVDLNELYDTKIELKDLFEEKILYSTKKDYCYGFSEVLDELNKILIADGMTIIAIYNKYGDIRWYKSDKITKP